MTKGVHSSLDIMFIPPFFLAIRVSNELLVHHQERCLIYCIIQFGTIVQECLAAMTLYIATTNTLGYSAVLYCQGDLRFLHRQTFLILLYMFRNVRQLETRFVISRTSESVDQSEVTVT